MSGATKQVRKYVTKVQDRVSVIVEPADKPVEEPAKSTKNTKPNAGNVKKKKKKDVDKTAGGKSENEIQDYFDCRY